MKKRRARARRASAGRARRAVLTRARRSPFLELRGQKSGRVYALFNAEHCTLAEVKRAALSIARRSREPIGASRSHKFMRNPAPPGRELARAATLYAGFTGRRGRVARVPLKPLPRVGLAFGELLELGYASFRDGRPYRHTFRSQARPLLISSHDGRQLVIVGGRYRFTHRGIEDR